MRRAGQDPHSRWRWLSPVGFAVAVTVAAPSPAAELAKPADRCAYMNHDSAAYKSCVLEVEAEKQKAAATAAASAAPPAPTPAAKPVAKPKHTPKTKPKVEPDA
jgi:hypothetical protein